MACRWTHTSKNLFPALSSTPSKWSRASLEVDIINGGFFNPGVNHLVLMVQVLRSFDQVCGCSQPVKIDNRDPETAGEYELSWEGSRKCLRRFHEHCRDYVAFAEDERWRMRTWLDRNTDKEEGKFSCRNGRFRQQTKF